ncbi:acyl-CoA dehydrogenase family protein [Acrocarpospora catenulata]|uniref:acyl-CoA dehydrogenase family protein n=1 Tax=Acrocarpospora catenulata TaxID=2836182 RepID=UPI001BDB5BC7|nr:acyl-CoA dehydrogenase family protein [Acrocarpospora catenulata]
MYLRYTPEQIALQEELRAYFDQIMTPELREQLRNGYSVPEATDAYRAVIRRLGQDGWLRIGWPKELGGQGRTMVEQAIFNEEAAFADVPTPLLTINSVAPAIAAFGTEEQKRTILAGILAGEVHFAIGYSEPEAGTDLASLRTRAVRDGNEYVIHGQKLWTGMMEAADYIWLAVRTDPDAPKHKGISLLLVPRHSPGISSTRLATVGDHSVAAVGFDGVRVPLDSCIGGQNNGWALMTGQLNSERVALVSTAGVRKSLDQVARWAATQEGDSGRLIDQEWVRLNLARVRAKTEFLRLLNLKLASSLDSGQLAPGDASAAKVFGSELNAEANRLLMEVVGEDALVASGEPGAVLGGHLQKFHRSGNVLTFIGGTNEIQRDLIAQLGLGLPRTRR